MKKRVYICSPLKATSTSTLEENVHRAKEYCKVACNEGVAPFAPHVFYTQFLDDAVAELRAVGFECGIMFLQVCDELWVCGNVISTGMQQEVNMALSLGIPVKYRAIETSELMDFGTKKVREILDDDYTLALS